MGATGLMKKIFSLITLLLLAGCAGNGDLQKARLDDMLDNRPPTYQGGSIWQQSSAGFAEDMKARRRGDTLTVIIVETASASKEATTATKRGGSYSAGIPNFMGLETNMSGIKNWMDLSKLISASSDSKFDGSGTTTRKENLSATITARVMDVLANGNLRIEGRRNIKVNNEDQIIILEGSVRQRDITPDNVISSSQIADARITYTGKGIVSDRQSPGWLMSLLDVIWPF